MRSFLKLSVLALPMLAALAPVAAVAQKGHDMDWDQGKRHYTPWREPFCKLQFEDVYHPGADQPLHFFIRNKSDIRLTYRIAVDVKRNGRSVGTGSIFVDNSNPNERNESQTSAFRGSLSGTTIDLRITACSQRH